MPWPNNLSHTKNKTQWHKLGSTWKQWLRINTHLAQPPATSCGSSEDNWHHVANNQARSDITTLSHNIQDMTANFKSYTSKWEYLAIGTKSSLNTFNTAIQNINHPPTHTTGHSHISGQPASIHPSSLNKPPPSGTHQHSFCYPAPNTWSSPSTSRHIPHLKAYT